MNTNVRRKPPKPRAQSAPRDGEGSAFRTLLRGALWGLVTALATALVLLLVLTAIAYSSADPDVLVVPFAYAALLVSTLAGGIAAAKISGAAGLLSGTLTGLLLLIVLFVASLFVGSSETDAKFGVTLAFYVGVILVCAAGGMLGSYKPKRRRRRISPK